MSDLISRQGAIDICNSAIDLWHGQLGEGALVAVKEGLEELPSAEPERFVCAEVKLSKEEIQDAVDKAVEKMMAEIKAPERKKGKWLRSGMDLYPYECDQCGCTNDEKSCFCPDCGALMEGEEDD